MSLVQELIRPLLKEDVREIAVYGGGFKPPTAGHFEVVKTAMEKNPNIDKFIILIGGKDRDGVSPEDSLLIWDIYKQYLPIKTEIKLSSKPPIQAVYNYAKEHPEEQVLFVIGAREGNEDDFSDIAKRTKSVDNYPNLKVETVITQGGASGTAARNAAKTDISKLKPLLPKEITDEEVETIYNLISDKITEKIDLEKAPEKSVEIKTYGDLKLALANIKKDQNLKKFKDVGGKAFSAALNLLPGVGTAIDAYSVFKAAFNKPDNVKTNTWLDKLDVDDDASKIVDDTVENEFLKIASDKFMDEPDDKVLDPNFNMDDELNSHLKKQFNARHIGGVNEGRKKKKDPKKGTGKKPKGSSRRLYTDEDPKDTVGVKFSSRQDIVDTFNKKSFKAKSHARQSQVINLVHQRVRAAYNRAKDPAVKKRLKTALAYAEKRKEASKKKTQRLKKLKEGDTYEKMAAKGKKAGSLKQGTVRKRLKIPKGKKIPLSLINKEISRMKKMDKDDKKKGVQLGDKNQKYYKALQLAKTLKTTTNLNEVLNPATFDYKPIIASLTKSMEKDGLNLQPYPTIRFIHDEEANADDFFGRTAYYNPNNKEIVLYTLGRHPKDIMRSYAHELIHVHQDNEDRLHNVQTSDVNADEYLEQLEREAYETGNIMFRSWTNSITEGKKKVKDPFGLNAFAYELAMLREDETINEPNIYLDMDGVVANFEKRFEDLSGMLPQAYVDKNGLNAFWDLIDEKHKVAFWRGIEVMPGAEKLVNFVSQYPYQMLTAPSIKKQSVIGKGLWVKDKVGTLYPSKPKVFYRKAKEKHMVKPELTKNDILIDDRADTIGRWAGAGGTAILYQSADQVINDLKKLGL